MNRVDIAALAGGALLFVGPICPYAYFKGGGSGAFVDRTWSFFEVSPYAAWMIIILAGAIVGLVVLKRSLHILWCGILAAVILINASWFPFLTAYQEQVGRSFAYSSAGAGWGSFVLYGGTFVTIVAGLFALNSFLHARQVRPRED